MFGNGSIGLPVAVIWFALNVPQIAGLHARHEKLVVPAPDDDTVVKAPTRLGEAPIETVAELAVVEAQRNALAIPARARSFAFMLISLDVALAAALGCL